MSTFEEQLAAAEAGQKARTIMRLPHIEEHKDFRELAELCNSLLTVKGHDYTGGASGDEGRLKNFYAGAPRIGITPMQVLATYMYKHWSAIETFISKGKVESEAIEGRIADSVNYLFLLYAMIQHEKRKASSEK